jgi:hypothetical protein
MLGHSFRSYEATSAPLSLQIAREYVADMASLIVQRQALDRMMFRAKWAVGAGGILVVGSAATAILAHQWVPLVFVGYGVVSVGRGIIAYVRARRSLVLFEDENGAGAGVQVPIRDLTKPGK